VAPLAVGEYVHGECVPYTLHTVNAQSYTLGRPLLRVRSNVPVQCRDAAIDDKPDLARVEAGSVVERGPHSALQLLVSHGTTYQRNVNTGHA
jgi:hypothetical protein